MLGLCGRGEGDPVESKYLKSLSRVRFGKVKKEPTHGIVHDEKDDRG